MFVFVSLLHPSLISARKAKSLLEYDTSLDNKYKTRVKVINSAKKLTYYDVEEITSVKSFIGQTHMNKCKGKARKPY